MAQKIVDILQELFVGAGYTVFAVGVALFYTWSDATIGTVAAALVTTFVLFLCAVACAWIRDRV